ncbi:NTP transferase domain-containing protein [Gordonia sp. PKS22-38]|uniref:NTP transferase domain-containing protein n=1 Tax=Gordonia prachuapensis TaxID=3115651 RepID=A0ABU7MQ65_9ACTN|nr:NTP transferase domain-containing protein [Gordonia sp. PKS22-38]
MIMGAVLAAGAGTRYGGPKVAAERGDWLRRAVAALSDGGCDEVLVAMGASIVEPPTRATTLVVADWADGMGATVRAVVAEGERRGADAVVMGVVDTPDVGADVVRRVLAVADGSRTALVRATYGSRPGHPVYLGAEHLRGVRAVVSGDVGARPYLDSHRDMLIDVECGDLATGLDHDERS